MVDDRADVGVVVVLSCAVLCALHWNRYKRKAIKPAFIYSLCMLGLSLVFVWWWPTHYSEFALLVHIVWISAIAALIREPYISRTDKPQQYHKQLVLTAIAATLGAMSVTIRLIEIAFPADIWGTSRTIMNVMAALILFGLAAEDRMIRRRKSPDD